MVLKKLRNSVKKFDDFLERKYKEYLKDMRRDHKERIMYGISGTSAYADHDYVIELAIEDSKKMKELFENTKKERKNEF